MGSGLLGIKDSCIQGKGQAMPKANIILLPPKPIPVPPAQIVRPCEWALRAAIWDMETQLGTIEAYNMLIGYANNLKAQIDDGKAKKQNPIYSTKVR